MNTVQEGWDAAMIYMASWCRKAKAAVEATGKITALPVAVAFEESAIVAENLVATTPVEPTR